MIHQGVNIILQFSCYRRALKQIRDKYHLNKGQFEILSSCYSLQKPKQPYFIVPDLIQLLGTVPKNKVYKYIHELECKGFIKMTLQTRSRTSPNYYSVTGSGELLLRNFIEQLTRFIEQYK